MKEKTTIMTDEVSKDEKARLQREELLKKREHLVSELVLMPDGSEAEAYNTGDSATYMLMERIGFQNMITRLKKQGRPVQAYAKQYGGIEKYYLKATLDELRTVVPTE